MAVFHPSAEYLVDYAAGNSSEALGLLVATHLALCPGCRAAVGRLEALGGALIDGMTPSATHGRSLGGALAQLDRAVQEQAVPRRSRAAGRAPMLPRPLRDYLGAAGDELPWRGLFPGIKRIALPALSGGTAELLMIGAGRAIPRHTHRGDEFNLVLAGGFCDGADHYGRGDVAVADFQVNHRPVADSDGPCICFAVSEAPPRFTGLLGQVLNLFTGR